MLQDFFTYLCKIIQMNFLFTRKLYIEVVHKVLCLTHGFIQLKQF